jgi:hypothetical protein
MLIFASMNIQAEKIEIRNILTSQKAGETERILSNPVMVKRLEKSRKQIKDGKGVKIELDDVWK